jgi:hypothetical protein
MGPERLPETLVVNAQGRIACKHVGPFNRRLQAEGGS